MCFLAGIVSANWCKHHFPSLGFRYETVDKTSNYFPCELNVSVAILLWACAHCVTVNGTSEFGACLHIYRVILGTTGTKRNRPGNDS
jgi:hypothetical protein